MAKVEGHDIRDHVFLHWDTLAKALGLEGEIIRVWQEPDTEYLHVLQTGTEEQFRAEDSDFKAIAPGGYCEARNWTAAATTGPDD